MADARASDIKPADFGEVAKALVLEHRLTRLETMTTTMFWEVQGLIVFFVGLMGTHALRLW